MELDLCVNCGGIWLDGGELEDLTGFSLKNERVLSCPTCDVPLVVRNIGPVEVDHCPKCSGTWLDRGELQQITALTPEDAEINKQMETFKRSVSQTRNIEIAKEGIKIEGQEGGVDEVFVMYKDGLLITCSTKKVEKGVNEDILAGTLMTIQDFIEVSFGAKGESKLKEIKFGDREILIERGDNIITAVVASGDVPDDFNENVQDIIGKIENTYRLPLSNWDGNLSSLGGVQEIVKEIFGEKAAAEMEKKAAEAEKKKEPELDEDGLPVL